MQPEKIHEIIKEKYERLIWTIAHKISGDPATTELVDNYHDLWLAVFEAVDGFTKQNDYSNGPVEDWIETKPFDKYLKTCLWNKKNHKGKQIANKYEIHRDTVSTHLEEVLNVSSPGGLGDSRFWQDVAVLLSPEEQAVVSCILDDPNLCLTDEGKVKISPIQRDLGWNRKKIVGIMSSIKKKMTS